MSFKYSVIIPHYNSEAGLEKLLKSIPNEDYIEVIVIDDRSETDSFLKKIESCHLNNITSYINEGTKGAGAARNIGLKKAKGEFLIFADSDDFFMEEAFINIDNALASCDLDVDLVFLNVTSQNTYDGLGFRHLKISRLVSDYINQSDEYYEEKIRFTHNGPIGKIFRHAFIKENKILFDETIIANDGMFSLKAGMNAKKINVFDKVIYCITQSDTSLTGEKNVHNYRVRLEVFVRYYNYLTEEDRFKARVSPLPLLYLSTAYGFKEFVRAIIFLRENKISFFKNRPFSIARLKLLYSRLSK